MEERKVLLALMQALNDFNRELDPNSLMGLQVRVFAGVLMAWDEEHFSGSMCFPMCGDVDPKTRWEQGQG